MVNKSKYEVHICILQNGHPIAEATCPVQKSRTLKITSSPNGLLSIPYYPLLEDIQILQIKNRKVFLLLNQPWEGYLSSEGRTVHLKPQDRTERTFRLQEHDFANIVLTDLRLMIKIKGVKPPDTVPLDPKYRAHLGSIMFDNSQEKKGMLIGIFSSILFFFALSLALFNLDTKRPQVFEELENLYTLPFINSQSFNTAPEALQTNLDRRDLISSVTNYYRNITKMIMGWPIDDPKVLFDSSINNYQGMYQAFDDQIQKSIENQLQVDSRTQEDRASQMIKIPSVLGESFQQKLLRTLTKVDTLHKGFNVSLELRKNTTASFKKDPDYDWGQYLRTNDSLGLIKVESANELTELTKISVFNQKTNEEMMYFRSQVLGEKAGMRRKYLRLKSDRRTPLTSHQTPNIYIPQGVNFVSFVSPQSFNHNSDKIIKQIRGLDYKKQNRDKVKEPLIGRINTRHLEQAIKKNRFQLNLCYELALRRNQNLRGKMHWVWRIDSLGKVSDISLVKSTLRDRQMINCVRRKLASWSFPRPKRGSVKINHRFDFEPQGG
ncbi:MAG: AgmX/PglI C-terminal domain-containing protein [Oligoflexales bacterium]|nr:AgmX/PglI C-terminal domain-containing protein [Oligoflexales bacterium]